MSAYIVSKPHIDALIGVALNGPADVGPRYPGDGWQRPYFEGQPLTPEYAGRLGTVLSIEVYRSVSHRYYAEKLDELPKRWVRKALGGFGYDYAGDLPGPGPRRLTVIEALVAIAGYEYQSCEHPGWEASAAKAFCDSLKDRLIHALPGWDEARSGATCIRRCA